MGSLTPLGALGRGLVAGAAGSDVIDLFFRLTRRIAPGPPSGFEPPEPVQKEEQPTETIARRLAEGLMQRGPLEARVKARAGTAVHYAYGAAWGGLYGLTRESFRAAACAPSALAFGALVWGAGLVLLPWFRLAPWAHRVPLAAHAYHLASHMVYGMGTWAAYEALRPRTLNALASRWWEARLSRAFVRAHLPRGIAHRTARSLAAIRRAGTAGARAWRQTAAPLPA